MTNQFNFFGVQVRQRYQVFRVKANKNTKSVFPLNHFFVDMLFFRVRQNDRLSSSLKAIERA